MNDVYTAQREERQADGRQPGQLVGRDSEMERIHAFLASARTNGGAPLVTGAPGVGKTVLLNGAFDAASAAGIRILRAAGLSTKPICFTGLNQVPRRIRTLLRG